MVGLGGSPIPEAFYSGPKGERRSSWAFGNSDIKVRLEYCVNIKMKNNFTAIIGISGKDEIEGKDLEKKIMAAAEAKERSAQRQKR
jgi:hypothetical protein